MTIDDPLADLAPNESVPHALRVRVLAAYRRRRIAASATAIVCTVSLCALMLIPPPATEAGNDPALAVVSITPAEPLLDLLAIDQALQSAYDRGASDDEIAPMWQERRRLLRLIRPHST